MSRPFRLQPPDVEQALLRRDLVRDLLGRFDARVTVVRAGPGFGKTTAVAQAMDQNRLASHGIDVWLGCGPADADERSLRAGLAQALDVDGEPTVTALLDAVAARSPAHVCLVLDDVHLIPEGSTGAGLLARLAADLPANGHLLVTSRHQPPVALSRLDAQGLVHRISEPDLALADDEIATLARAAGRSPDPVMHLGGWPALVALGLRSGRVSDFIDEEIISDLDADQRQILSAVVAVGGGDQTLLRALTGLDADHTLGDLPMVHSVDGWYEAHDLWHSVLDPSRSETDVQYLQRTAVDHLLATGRPARAADLARRSGIVDLIVTALRQAIIVDHTEEPDLLRTWSADLPEQLSAHPLTMHLRGLLAQIDDPSTDRCRELFARAADGFAAIGDLDGEVAAVAEMGFWHHIHRDVDGLTTVGLRMHDLAGQGVASAVPYVDVLAGFVALSRGDAEAILAAVRRARSQRMTGRFGGVTDWLEVMAKELLGIPDVALADRYLESAGAIRGTEVLALSSRWRAGLVEELLPDVGRWEPTSGSDRVQFLGHAWMTVACAGTGALARARHHLALTERFVGERRAAQVEITTALPRILVLYEEGAIGRAATELADLLERVPVSPATRLSYNGAAAVIARHHPDVLDDAGGPFPSLDTGLGRALREMDETGSLTAIAAVDWPDRPGKLLTSLFLRNAVEMVCAGWAAQRPDARGAAEWLLDVIGTPARDRFRDMTDHPIDEVALAARHILSHVPVPPDRTRRVMLLGPERLYLGTDETIHDDWRRERVRALLGFLVCHHDTTRDAAMTALWPDATEDSSRRNLRSTLNLLHRVLEPARAGGDAAYFVRSDSHRLELSGGPRLEVDVWRFDHLLDTARRLETDGVPSLALDEYLAAIELHRGGFLPGVNDSEWLDLERQRLHLRFVSAAIRAAELLIAHGRVDEAVVLATRAVEAEPWSEPAHRALVASHLERGDRAAAHRAMQRCHELLEELGGPGDELTHMLARRLTTT